MFPISIRWRLQLWLGFLLTFLLIGFGGVVYQLHRIQEFNRIDEELERRIALLGADFRMPPMPRGLGMRPPFDRHPGGGPGDREDPGRPFGPNKPRQGGGGPPDGFRDGMRPIKISEEVAALFGDGGTNAFYFIIWSRGGAVLRTSSNAPPDLELPTRSEGTRMQARTRKQSREVYQVTELGDALLVGRPIVNDLQALTRFAFWLSVPGMTVLLLGLGVGWWITTRAIRPIEEISSAASRISAGNLSERIPIKEKENELGQLAAVLNSTFARLDAAFAQQKQFTADASHELRTPLAVLISEAQTTLARPRNAEEYRETVTACLEIAQEMRQLTESLLELARSDLSSEVVPKEVVDFSASVSNAVTGLIPFAEAKGVVIEQQVAPVSIRGDSTRLKQVVVNLVSNAIQYNREQGTIRVALAREGAFALLTVQDTGIGISDQDLPHVFERFYRADKSRSRAAGHFGLGLAICKGIVDAHGGDIAVSSVCGEGTTFTVRLPAQPLLES